MKPPILEKQIPNGPRHQQKTTTKTQLKNNGLRHLNSEKSAFIDCTHTIESPYVLTFERR